MNWLIPSVHPTVQPELTEVKCAYCGSPVPRSKTKPRKFCSGKCQAAHYVVLKYWRRKELREKQDERTLLE